LANTAFAHGYGHLAAIAIGYSMGFSASPTIVRFADCEPEPWANGTGVTRVLVKESIRPSPTDFDWRLSVADVSTSGPFSILPGVDRVITLTDGAGVLLKVDDDEFALDPFRPLRFAGEARTECVVSEPVRDFNVMTRRDTCSATVGIQAEPGTLAAQQDSIGYVVALKGQVTVRLSGGDVVTLDRFDTLLLATAAQLEVTSGARAALVRIRRLNSS
jgi:uncharacterized protein